VLLDEGGSGASGVFAPGGARAFTFSAVELGDLTALSVRTVRDGGACRTGRAQPGPARHTHAHPRVRSATLVRVELHNASPITMPYTAAHI
jgi:hypothetical protein